MSTLAAANYLKANHSEVDALLAALALQHDGDHHTWQLEFEDGELFIFDEHDSGQDIPVDLFFVLLGNLIAKNSAPYLEFGESFNETRFYPGSIGGTSFRVYPDGALVHPTLIWDRDATSSSKA